MDAEKVRAEMAKPFYDLDRIKLSLGVKILKDRSLDGPKPDGLEVDITYNKQAE